MTKIMDCTNTLGIIRTTVTDDYVTVVMTYDSGDKWSMIIPMPHKMTPKTRVWWTKNK